MHRRCMTRRRWLSVAGTTAAAGLLPRPAGAQDAPLAPSAPTSPVAIAKCRTYGSELVPALAQMFDQLGGLESLVRGKTAAIKLNLVGAPWMRLGDSPPEFAQWVHPAVIGAALHLLDRAGAYRIRLVECCNESLGPFEEFVQEAGWDPGIFLSAAPRVEFENTNGPGPDGAYSRILCPSGGLVFPGFDVNHSYTDCDVFVSLAKMKEHSWFGVTLSTKNCYGMTPMTIYGDTAGVDEPATEISGTRVHVMHEGSRAPSLSAPQEIDPASPRSGDYRMPRIITDVVSARPVDLAIIDGIETMAGGEGPWAPNARRVSPGVLVAGLNSITTDAVATAVMGFDPLAGRGTPPFDDCDSFLEMAEQVRLGTRDLSRIEVLGASIADARFEFRSAGLARLRTGVLA